MFLLRGLFDRLIRRLSLLGKHPVPQSLQILLELGTPLALRRYVARTFVPILVEILLQSSNRPITLATMVEVGGIAVLFPLLGWRAGWIGVTAAAVAIMVGRLGANGFLMIPCREALKRST